MKFQQAAFLVLLVTCIYQVALVTNIFLKINIGKIAPTAKLAGVEQSLPSEATAAKALIDKYHLPDFKLSEGLFNRIYEQQRIIEYAYPIRYSDLSKFILSIDDEDISKHYKYIDSIENISLYEKK